MKKISIILIAVLACIINMGVAAQTAAIAKNKPVKHKASDLYIDVHHLEPGKITTADVAAVHAKDLAVQNKYHVHFIKYWVDTAKGEVYCLSASHDSASISKAHADAHGLLPAETYLVSGGHEAVMEGNKNLYLDVHELGAGNVTTVAVTTAHKKDLTVQKKHGVNFINYWVDEKKGKVFCLSEANDSSDVIQTHKEAHGLLPTYLSRVKEGE